MDAVGFDAVAAGSMWTAPFRLPPDFDVTRPSKVYVDLACTIDNALPGQVAMFRVQMARTPPTGQGTSTDVNAVLNVPNPWTTDDLIRFFASNGDDYTFDAATFLPTDLVALKLIRIPGDPIDNYAQIVASAACLTIEYYQRCQRLCCP